MKNNIKPAAIYTVTLIFCLLSSMVLGQISGHIVDEDNLPLPYATVYINGTSIGTVANSDGMYILHISNPGTYDVVFQYVGYKTETARIDYKNKPTTVNKALTPEVEELAEVTISINKEDPAYPIIREAIRKRDFHRHQVKSYESDLYVKGKVKVLDAPKKVLGTEIGNLGGILDTTRQGIVYLSESTAKYYYQDPDKSKEVMISSIKSGENDVFTANRFDFFKFNIYDQKYRFQKAIASPLSDDALSNYKYALEQSFYNEQREKIYKIKIIPKYSGEPLLSGFIYIVDGSFNVHSLDAIIGKSTLKGTFLDSIQIRQVYVPVGNVETRMLLSQVINFGAGFMGLKMGGTFTYIFSNYELDKDVSMMFKNNETFSVSPQALKKDTAYWASTRPIPLSADEAIDYVKKDSLANIWKSKPFLDSLDKANNRFSILKLLRGYTYQNSFRNYTISTPKTQELYTYNAVEGSKINMSIGYTISDSLNRFFEITPKIVYGFADKEYKPMITVKRMYDNYNSAEWYGQLGRKYWQYDYTQPVPDLPQTLNALFLKINRIRLYDLRIVEMGWKREVINGLYLDLAASYQDRRTLQNNTNYSVRWKNRTFSSNKPDVLFPDAVFGINKYAIQQLRLTWRPQQQYSSYPNLKLIQGSKWPTFQLFVNNYIGLNDLSTSFVQATALIKDDYIATGLMGYTRFSIKGGSFFGGKPSFFGDFYHPTGNEALTPYSRPFLTFNLMPFYKYSTDGSFVEAHWRHNFEGYFFNHLPLLKKTPWGETIGAAIYSDKIHGNYIEFMAGIEDIKVFGIKICDLEYSWAFNNKGKIDQGFVIRLNRNLF
jgi:hypothetical protein